MPKKLLLMGDHFITPNLMLQGLGDARRSFDIVQGTTPFPLEPFRDIAEVREASGSEEEMIDLLQGVSVCVVHHAPLTKRIIAHAKDLKLFIVCRGGPVNVNLQAATAAGITIGFTPGRNAVATAEFTVATALAALRRIPFTDRGIRNREWIGTYTYETAGFEINGSTCGLIGYGAIGSRVAKILQGFGAKVLVYDPYSKTPPDPGVEITSLEDLLKRSRLVSLHARETPETRKMIGRKQISLMPRGSVLVNCARGSLLDYDALQEALESGHLFAAAADVFPDEPIPTDSPLLRLQNFVMTPHIAGGTQQAAEKAAHIAGEEIRRYMSGAPLSFCANPETQVTQVRS
ncbi:MAG TPA: 2-hydroxyacid dehydrogenase [Terriglobales bacterium]|nr:2-hydroxyacid dehydrogenase [Terriglobales bacterium]